ncbi:MAG TPA: zinc-binding dehydrogenase [Propionibacteriaceae bacterium]|nr:zinc-binding dehydrogenase [Propionibacteriaceae bacterium]
MSTPEQTTATTMLAERFYAATKEIKLEHIPIPTPGPGEVLIKVAYCGICHSDLSLIDGNFPARVPVITQGHEVAGTVTALGPGVNQWKVGDRVIPSAGKACLSCRNCLRGDFANCLDLNLMAFAYDGGWAEYVVAGAIGCTRVPDNVPLEQAALLADAVSTPFAAVVRTAKVHLGNAVGIWGVGGVGTHLVQLVKLAGGVPIIAVDINDAALERATRLGADYAFRSDDPDLNAKINEATGGRRLDVAFDAVGISATTRQAVANLDSYGQVVTVGMSAQNIEAGSFMEFSLLRKQIKGHLGYKVQDISILAELLSRGRLDLSESVTEIVPLSEIHRGIEMLEKKTNNPIRILVKP